MLKRTIFRVSLLFTAMTLSASLAFSQSIARSDDPYSNFAHRSLLARSEFRFLTSQPPPANPFASRSPTAPNLTLTAMAVSGFPTITGNGNVGQIAYFSAGTIIRGSIITQSKAGNIGIGTTTPGSKLSVAGMIESLSGGFTFPDGTVQTSAGLTSIPVPLILSVDVAFPDAVINVNNPDGIGVFSFSANDVGVLGSSALGTGVRGNSSIGFGVSGESTNGTGVRGLGGTGPGVVGSSTNSDGVRGFSNSGFGVRGESDSGAGVLGFSSNFAGVRGESNSSDGVFGSSDSGFGVRGISTSGTGVRGGSDILIGVEGISPIGFGVVGSSDSGTGVLGVSNSGLAGDFNGDVSVSGNLTKGGGSFKIDHPLDPENRYLYHSFVESPDMMNVYNGDVTTDLNGEAVVTLPEYFQALNKDFRYQLTVIGQFAQAIVSEEIHDNRFTIKTDYPSVKVSWQVTGIRQDAWAKKNRIQVEVEKKERERGFYLHPEVFNQPEERSLLYLKNPELVKQKKEAREQMKRGKQ